MFINLLGKAICRWKMKSAKQYETDKTANVVCKINSNSKSCQQKRTTCTFQSFNLHLMSNYN